MYWKYGKQLKSRFLHNCETLLNDYCVNVTSEYFYSFATLKSLFIGISWRDKLPDEHKDDYHYKLTHKTKWAKIAREQKFHDIAYI